MGSLLRLLVIGLLIAIVASLGSALRHLSRGAGAVLSRSGVQAKPPRRMSDSEIGLGFGFGLGFGDRIRIRIGLPQSC